MTNRRTFLAGTGAVLFAGPLAAEAQQAGRIYRCDAADPGGRPSGGEPRARVHLPLTGGMFPRRTMRSESRRAQVLLWITLAGLVSGCAASTLRSRPGTTTTVILLRHADRDASTELNAKGRERAQALVAAVSGMGITAIYSPDVARNLDTVRPLAAYLDVEITITPRVSVLAARDIAKEILSRHAGGVVVYVGNVTGNLYAVYHQLGGTGTAPEEYGDLAILTVPDQGPVKVERRRFGP